MEDDVLILQDPNILSELIDKLDQLVGKGNWDILFTDRDIRDADGYYVQNWGQGFYEPWGLAKRPDYLFYAREKAHQLYQKVDISPDFRLIGSRFGAHSMIVRRSGIAKLLEYFKAHQIYLPYDLEYLLPQGIRLFTVSRDVVSNTPKALSDNGEPNYLLKQ